MNYLTLLFGLIFVGTVSTAAETPKWTIQTQAPTPKAEGPKPVPTYVPGPPVIYSELTGARVMAKKSESEVAEAFGYTPNNQYTSKGTPTGTVSTVSLAHLLALAFPNALPEQEAAINAQSLCRGKDLVFMQSVISRGSRLEVYGIRRTCSDDCFTTVEIQQNKKVLETTNEYPVNATLCKKAMGE